MNKLPREKRDKIILVAVLTFAISFGIWFLVLRAQRATLTEVQSEVQQGQDRLSRGNATLKSSEQVQQQFEEVSRRLQQREAAMAAPNDMYSWLIQTLNSFRLNYRVEIPQFGREIPAEVGVFPKFPYRAALFSVRGSATYHDFGRFLADFENSFPYIRVQNVEIEPAQDPTGEEARRDTSADAREKLNFKVELLTLVRPVGL